MNIFSILIYSIILCCINTTVFTIPVKMANSLPENGYYRVYQHCLGYGYFESQGFNDRGKKVKLADTLFKKDLKLKDIYLGSKISEQGYLTLPGAMFGATPDEQYLNLLANTDLNFDVEEKSMGLLIKTLYAMPTNKFIKKSELCMSIDIPLVIKNRTIHFSADGGKISSGNANAFNQFFTDNTDFFGFFKDQVLKSKNITLKHNQTIAGIGNCTLYGYFRFANTDRSFHESDIGFSLQLPTGRKSTGSTLWEIDLSDDDSVLLNLFANFSFQTNCDFLNPYCSLSLGYHFGYHKAHRVPMIKNEKMVSLPSAFDGFKKLPFSSFDVTSKQFADKLTSCSISGDIRSTIIVGNSCRYYFASEFELLAYLQFDYKQKNSFTVLRYDQLKRMANAASVMNTALSVDADYYNLVEAKVAEVKPVFINMNEERDATFACIRSRFSDMKNQLSTCQSDTEIYVDNARREISILKSDLEGLRERTTKEINALTHDKTVIEGQLADLTEEYAADTAEFTEGASDLLLQLKNTVEKYNNTIKERDEFIVSVDELIKMLNQDISGDTSALIDLRKEIC